MDENAQFFDSATQIVYNISDNDFVTVTGTILPVSIAIPGIIGNIMTYYVFYTSRPPTTARLFLEALTIWDSFVLLMVVIDVILDLTSDMSIYAKVRPFGRILLGSGMTGSLWTATLLVVERLFAIRHPFKYQQWCTELRTRIALILIAFLAFCYVLPQFWEHVEITPTSSNQTINLAVNNSNTTSIVGLFSDNVTFSHRNLNKFVIKQHSLPSTSLLENVYYTWIYRFFIDVICTFIVPLICMLVSNGMVIYETSKSIRMHGYRWKESAEIKSITKMLTVEAAFFVLFNMPTATVICIMTVDSQWTSTHQSEIEKWALVAYNCIILNSSTNFFIFYIFGKSFRHSANVLLFQRCEPICNRLLCHKLVEKRARNGKCKHDKQNNCRNSRLSLNDKQTASYNGFDEILTMIDDNTCMPATVTTQSPQTLDGNTTSNNINSNECNNSLLSTPAVSPTVSPKTLEQKHDINKSKNEMTTSFTQLL